MVILISLIIHLCFICLHDVNSLRMIWRKSKHLEVLAHYMWRKCTLTLVHLLVSSIKMFINARIWILWNPIIMSISPIRSQNFYSFTSNGCINKLEEPQKETVRCTAQYSILRSMNFVLETSHRFSKSQITTGGFPRGNVNVNSCSRLVATYFNPGFS